MPSAMPDDSTSTVPPKSILKKTAAQGKVAVPPGVNIPPPKTDKEILESIEALSLLPAAASPTPAEADHFTSAVSVFQPSDYTALLEERMVNGLCGYALCSRPPLKTTKGREWLRAEADKQFCSIACARKAMYVRAQLDETPAWERRGGLGTRIVLLNDGDTQELPLRSRADDASGPTLAAERGEKAQDSDKVKLVSEDVVEKETTGRPRVNFVVDDFAHESIEGYKISATKHIKRKDDT